MREEILLSLLEDLSEAPLLCALEKLAQFGSQQAIAPILKRSRRLLTRAIVREAATAATTAIGARTGALSGGELSVVETSEGGEVSLSAEEGTLHLPTDDA